MLVGSDDAVKIWLNGKLVHANNIYRAAEPGQDKVPVLLKRGKNTLLVKLMEGIFGCGFYIQFCNEDGSALDTIRGM
jgi:hypothetical protein